MTTLRIAIQKSGRLNEDSLKIIKDCGISIDNGKDQLKASARNFPLEVFYLRNGDIPQYLRDGVVDIAIIGENVLNFHYSDDCYYEEWADETYDGWIAAVNFQEHVLREMSTIGIDQYLLWGGDLNDLPWRTFKPQDLMLKIESIFNRRLGM